MVYILPRTQVVKVGDNVSVKQSIKTGVPQGSMLGPLLIFLYINDLPLTVADSAIDLYADDSSWFKTGKQIPRCTGKSSAYCWSGCKMV